MSWRQKRQLEAGWNLADVLQVKLSGIYELLQPDPIDLIKPAGPPPMTATDQALALMNEVIRLKSEDKK